MTPRPRKAAAKKTTSRAPAKEAVAEEAPVEQKDETVAAPPSPPVDEPVALVPPPLAPAPQQPQHLVGLGPCRVCGGPGAIRAEFPWTADAPVFCRRDTPPQYRHLLHA